MDLNSHWDPSVDYSRYPTFVPLPRPQYRCTRCGCRDFGLLMPQCRLLCRGCSLEQELPVPVAKPEAHPEQKKLLPRIQI